MGAIDVDPITIPDGFTVWAGSDWHGQLAAADRLLGGAGLTDGAGRWTAPPRTALVLTGDLVDRGPDAVGLVRRMVDLREQAAAAGGLVAILEGNHEAQVLGGLWGEPTIWRALHAFGGGATFLSAGLTPPDWAGRDAAWLRDRMDALAPGFLAALWSFAPWARWRDTLFVHGGPVPFQDLDRWTRGADRLWIRDAFFAAEDAPFPDAAAWSAWREAGIGRVVFGHTPVARATTFHDGRALDLDTWKGELVTLARIPPAGHLGEALVHTEPAQPRAMADAPVTADEVRAFDATLPAIVDAWLERVGTDHPRR